METLHIGLGPSRRLAVALAALHGFAAVMLWLSPVSWWLLFTALPLLAGSLVFYERREGWRLAPAAVVSFTLYPDCRCEFQTRDGTVHAAELLGSSFVAPYLTVLNLKPDDAFLARHVVIVPDNVDAEQFRKLRVALKWHCGKR